MKNQTKYQMPHGTLKTVLWMSLTTLAICAALGHIKQKSPASTEQFIYMDLMVIDERGRSIHGAELSLENTVLGTTDSHGRWARMVRIPVEKSVTLMAKKSRLGADYEHREQFKTAGKELKENSHRISRVVQFKNAAQKLF